MIPLGIAAFLFTAYGIYLCFRHEDDLEEFEQELERKYPSKTVVINLDQYRDPEEQDSDDSSDEEEPEDSYNQKEINNLWDSCHLELKYNEIRDKTKIPHLGLPEFKEAIRQKLSDFLNDSEYQSDWVSYIKSKRSAREKNYYAVIEDTALNLLEYYEEFRGSTELKED